MVEQKHNSKSGVNRARLQQTIDVIADNFFIDPEKKTVGNTVINHWNTTLLALSYIMDEKPLIIGEPGFAKTTAAKVISSLMSGYPFDLYEAAQIQGHPDQTYETMIARPDFSKLSHEESVIWLLSAYLPVRIIDEINRLPTGNQDQLLNVLETGRFNYLNATFYTGKSAFFATANHPDDGNHILIPPLRDRFSIHLELGNIGATYSDDIERAQENIEEIKSPELTTKIIAIINDKTKSIEDKLLAIDESRKEYVLFIKSKEIEVRVYSDKKNIQAEIKSVPFSDEANILSQIINAELNYSPLYGRKRSNDPVDTSNHADKLASKHTKNACSPRAISAIRNYSRAIAYITGEDRVTKKHIMAIAPYVLGHRLEFTQDFRAEHEEKKREGYSQYGTSMETHLAAKLMEGIHSNYKTVKPSLDLIFTAFKTPDKLTEEQKKKANEILKDETLVDHPLIREYIGRVKEVREKF